MNVAELLATAGFDIDFESVAQWTSILNKAADQTRQVQAQAKLGASLEAVHGNTDRALSMISLGDQATRATAAAEKGTTNWGRALVVANQGLELGLKLYGRLAQGVGFLRGMVDQTSAVAAHANDMAARLGMSVEAVQELGYAASQSSTDADTLGGGLKSLSDKADAATKGAQDAARALHQVGLSGSDLRSGKIPLDSALRSIADRFAAMPDGARKSALAVDLFGNAGVKLIPLLNKGAAGIGELRAEAQSLGIVMGKDVADAAAGLGDAQAKLSSTLAGIRNQAIAALLPALSELVARIQEWVKANRQLLVNALTGALQLMLAALRAVGVVVGVVAKAFAFWAEHSTALKVALSLLAAAFVYMGVSAAVAWIAALGPVGLIALAIAALILLFPHIADGIKAAGRSIADVAKAVGRAFEAAGRAIVDAFRAVGRFIEGVALGIRDGFAAALDWVGDKIEWLVDKARDGVRWIRDNIPGAPAVLGDPGSSTRGGATRTATTPGRQTASITHKMEVNVNAPMADTETVRTAVRESFKPMFDAQIRQAADGIG